MRFRLFGDLLRIGNRVTVDFGALLAVANQGCDGTRLPRFGRPAMDETPHQHAHPHDAEDTGFGPNPVRRSFLKGAVAGGAASLATFGLASAAQALQADPGTKQHHFVPASGRTVHWGYFSKV